MIYEFILLCDNVLQKDLVGILHIIHLQALLVEYQQILFNLEKIAHIVGFITCGWRVEICSLTPQAGNEMPKWH